MLGTKATELLEPIAQLNEAQMQLASVVISEALVNIVVETLEILKVRGAHLAHAQALLLEKRTFSGWLSWYKM